MSNNKHLQNEWRRWTAKLREDAAGRLVHPNGLVATLERDADGRPNVGVWRCAIPQSGEAGEQFVYPVVLRFSTAFPQEPPDVRFEPPVWHPNVDPQTGALGLPAFLDAQQRPETSVEAILEQIQRVFEMPQPSPVLNEQAAYIRNYHFDTYEQIVCSQSHRFAAAVILKAFDLSRAALQTAFCALPTAPPPLSPGNSSDSSADRPGPSTRVRAAPGRKLKRHLETGPPSLKPSAAPPAALPAQSAAQSTADAPPLRRTAGATAQPHAVAHTVVPPPPPTAETSPHAPFVVKIAGPPAQPRVAPQTSAPPASSPPKAPVAPALVEAAAHNPFVLMTAGATAQPSAASLTSAQSTLYASFGPFVSAPSAGAIAEARNEARVKEVRDQMPTTPADPSSAPMAAPPAAAPTAPTVKQPPTSASSTEVPPAQQPTAPLGGAPALQQPPPPTNDSSQKPTSASVPFHEAPVEEKDGKATVFIPWAAIINREPFKVLPSSQPSAGAADRTTYSTSKTIVAKQTPSSASGVQPPVAPAQATTAPLTREQPPASSNVAPPTSDSSPKPPAAPVPSTEAAAKGPREQTTTSIPWAGAFCFGEPNGTAANQPPPFVPFVFPPPVAEASAASLTALQASISALIASRQLIEATSASSTAEQPPNSAPSSQPTETTAAPPTAEQPITSAPVVQPPVPSSAGANAGMNTQQAKATAKQPIASTQPSSQPIELTAASSTAEQPSNSAPSAGTTAAQPPTPAPVVQPPAATTTNPPPAPLDVAPFALHADAIFRELQAAGRADLALRLRQKVVAVVNKFDEKLSDELERKAKPPVRPVRQPKPAQQPAVGAKPQQPKRPPIVYGANHLWTDESEDEAKIHQKEPPARRPTVQREENRRKQQPRDDRETNSPHVNLLGEPLPLPPNGPPAPPKQPNARGPSKPLAQQQMAQQLANISALQQQLATLSTLQQQQQSLFSQAPPLPFLPPPMAAAQLPGYPQYAPPGFPTPYFNDFAFPPQPMRPMPPPPRMGGPAGGNHSWPGMPVSQSGRPGPFFPVVFPMASAAVPTGQQQHAPPAAPVEAPKRPSPTAQPDERKELEDEVARLLKVQQDFIVQQRKEQAEWQKRLDELKAAPTASIDQPKEQPAAYDEFLMQKIRAIWTEEDRRQQAAASTARPAQKTKETRTKKTAEQKRQRAKKPPTAQPTEQKKTAVEETVARAKAQGDLLFERHQQLRNELQQQAEESTTGRTAQPAVQETNEAPVQPLTNEQKQRSQADALTARSDQKPGGAVALWKPNQDLLMHVQMPTKQLQQQAEESGSAEGSPSDMRAKIQQQLERFLSQQPAVEVVACWVQNPDGTTVPIAPPSPSTSTARIEEEPQPSASKEPESPAYSIVNLLDSEDETGWTDAEDVEVIDSDYQ